MRQITAGADRARPALAVGVTEDIGGEILAVLFEDVVGSVEVILAPEDVDQVANGALTAGLHHQFDGANALDAPVLVQDAAQLLRPLDGHVFVVLFDGPPPRLRFEDDEGVKEQIIGELVVVERAAVDVDAADGFRGVNQTFQSIPQFLVAYPVLFAFHSISFRIKVELFGVFASVSGGTS